MQGAPRVVVGVESRYDRSTMAEPARRQARRYTYGDLEHVPDGERWEIIDGVLYDMSPAPKRLHQGLSIRLASQLLATAEPLGCETYDAPFDVRLPDADEGDDEVATVVQPDIVVVCDTAKLDDAGCRGAPELVVEILSPRTSFKDQTQKLELYERHGVAEYWVINPEAGWLMVYRQEEGRRPEERRFAKPSYFRKDESVPVGILAGEEIDLRSVFPSRKS